MCAKRLIKIALAAGLVSLSSAGVVLTQSASQVTPSTFEPPTRPLTGTIVFPGNSGLSVPPGAEALTVKISGVSVVGGLPGMEAAASALQSRLTGGRIRVSEIFTAASDLETAYVDAGFILARVVLPAQELNDGGTLRLDVIDGYVERVDLTNVPEKVRGRIAKVTEELIGKRGLTGDELDRQLILAGDTYGVALSSALSAGSEAGGTILVLEGNYRKVTGFVGFDNTQSDALGTWSLNAGVELHSPFGFGEVIYARVASYANLFADDGIFDGNPRKRTFAIGGILPVGTDGLNFGVEYANSRTTPDNLVVTTSEFERLSFRTSYPIILKRGFSLSARGSFDFIEDQLDVLSNAGRLAFSFDKTRVLRAGLDADWVMEDDSRIFGSAVLSFGIDGFGARTQADALGGTPLSRPGADADFVKLEVQASYLRPLTHSLEFRGNAGAQLSFGMPLVTSEQFSISTLRGLSAFPAGSLVGDSGWFLRGEVVHSFDKEFAKLPFEVRPYAFAAAGAVYLDQPSLGEQGTVVATALGVGVEAVLDGSDDFSSKSIRLEVGQGHRDDGGDDGTRITVFGAWRF